MRTTSQRGVRADRRGARGAFHPPEAPGDARTGSAPAQGVALSMGRFPTAYPILSGLSFRQQSFVAVVCRGSYPRATSNRHSRPRLHPGHGFAGALFDVAPPTRPTATVASAAGVATLENHRRESIHRTVCAGAAPGRTATTSCRLGGVRLGASRPGCPPNGLCRREDRSEFPSLRAGPPHPPTPLANRAHDPEFTGSRTEPRP